MSGISDKGRAVVALAVVRALELLALCSAAQPGGFVALLGDRAFGYQRRYRHRLTRVLAIEVLAAARAIDMRRPLAPSPASTAVIAAVRRHVEGPGPDRYLAPEIEAMVLLARSGELVAAAQSVVGELD